MATGLLVSLAFRFAGLVGGAVAVGRGSNITRSPSNALLPFFGGRVPLRK